jgi:hypothetical protein
MNNLGKCFFLFSMITFVITESCFTQSSTKSQWVYPDAKGKLVYKTLESGDKIMDFSYAGYMGGGVNSNG